MKTARPALIIAFGAALDLAAKLWARTSLEPYGAATDFLPFVALRLTFNQGFRSACSHSRVRLRGLCCCSPRPH